MKGRPLTGQETEGQSVRGSILHITPASMSLTHLLKERLILIAKRGYRNIGFSTTENIKVNPEDTLSRAGIEYIESRYLTRRFSLRNDLMFFFETFFLVRKLRPNCVITYGPKPGYIARIAAKLGGANTVAHVFWGNIYSDFDPTPKKLVLKLFDQIASHFSNIIFSVNKPGMEEISRYPWLKAEIHYLGNATDVTGRFNPNNVSDEKRNEFRNTHGVSKNGTSKKIVVTLVGRVIRSKGYLEFIEAARRLTATRDDIIFWMAGPKDDIRATGVDFSLISQHMEIGRISYLGSIEVESMPLLYAASDIICLPSYREGFPRSLVEAAAMGKPLVATDISGCRETVLDGVNGLLVPPRNPEYLVRAIEKLVADEDLRIEMGRNSRILALRNFNQIELVEKMMSQIENHMVKLASSNPQKSAS